jgi:hypothetical protein
MEKWPDNYIDVSQVERLRLFCSGRELEDSKSVHGTLRHLCKTSVSLDLALIATAAGFAAVHVTVVNKSAKGAISGGTEEERNASTNKCLCLIM